MAKSNRKELMDTIYRKLIDGASENEICDSLGISSNEYQSLMDKIYETKTMDIVSMPAEHQYVQFAIEQQKCIKELDDMIARFAMENQYNAMVGAVRAKSQILGEIRKVGVSMGIIQERASMPNQIGGTSLEDMGKTEIRQHIFEELHEMAELIDKYGDGPITSSVKYTMARTPRKPKK